MVKTKNMKKFISSTATATLVASAILPTAAAANATEIKDMKSTEFGFKEVLELKTKGVIAGFPDGTFRPKQLLKREEAAKLLVTGLELNGDGILPSFSDIGKTSSWMPYINASVDHKIIQGNTDGSFGFGDYMTREQMASVIVRAFNLEVIHKPVEFKDIHTASIAHKNDIMILAQNGITIGYADGTFKPKEKINRVNFAVFLHRALEQSNSLEVEGSALFYNGESYTFGDEFKAFFSASNLPALKNAELVIQSSNGHITGITSVKIQSSNDITFDFGNKTFNGDFSVNANNVTLKNGSLNGDVTVNGGESINLLKVQSSKKINAKYGTTFAISESTLTNLLADTWAKVASISNSQKMIIDAKSTVRSLTLQSNMDVDFAGTSLLNLVLGEKATSVSFKGAVDTLTLIGTAKRTIEGLTAVKNFIVPSGTTAQELISNYTEVQKGYTPVLGGGSGGSGGTGGSDGNDGSDGSDGSDENGEDDEPTTPVANVIDLKEGYTVIDGQVYSGDFSILFESSNESPSKFEASSPGNEVVFNGDVLVKGTGYIDLAHIKVNGILTLDPGDDGGVKLTNVTADSIIVASGAMNTTTFEDVTTANIKVTDSNGGRIIMNGANYVDKFELSPTKTNVVPEFVLGGTFTSKIELTSDLKLSTDNNKKLSANSIEVKTNSSTSEIEIAGDLENVTSVKVSSPVTLNIATTAKVPSVDVATSSLTIKGDFKNSNVNVSQASNVTLAKDVIVGTVDINDSVGNVSINGDFSKSTQTLQVSSADKVTISQEDQISLEFYNKAVSSANLLITEYLDDTYSLTSVKKAKTIQSLIQTAKLFDKNNNYLTDIKDVDQFEIKAANEKSMGDLINSYTAAVKALPSEPVRKDELYIKALDALLKVVTDKKTEIKSSGLAIADWGNEQLLSDSLVSKLTSAISHSTTTQTEWTTTKSRISELLEKEIQIVDIVELKTLYSKFLRYQLTGNAELKSAVETRIQNLNTLIKLELALVELEKLKLAIPELTKENTEAYRAAAIDLLDYNNTQSAEFGNQWDTTVITTVNEVQAEIDLSYIYDYEKFVDAYIEGGFLKEAKYQEYVKVVTALKSLLLALDVETEQNIIIPYYSNVATKLDNFLVTTFTPWVPSEINTEEQLELWTTDGVDTEIVWTSSHPEIISNDGVVKLEKVGHVGVDVTLSAKITKGEAEEIQSFTVYVYKSDESAQFFSVGSNNFNGWKNYGKYDGRATNSLYISHHQDLNKLYPSINRISASIKLGEKTIEQDFLVFNEEIGTKDFYFNGKNILTNNNLSGDIRAIITLNLYDANGEMLETIEGLTTIISDFTTEVNELFEIEKNSFTTDTIQKYFINPKNANTNQLDTIIQEFNKLDISDKTFVNLDIIAEEVMARIIPLNVTSEIPLTFDGTLSFEDEGLKKVIDIRVEDGSGVEVTRGENQQFVINFSENIETNLTILFDDETSMLIPVVSQPVPDLLTSFNMIFTSNNNPFRRYYLDGILKYHVLNDRELSLSEDGMQSIMYLNNYVSKNNITKFNSKNEIQAGLNYIDTVAAPLEQFLNSVSIAGRTIVERGKSYDLRALIDAEGFNEFSTDENVRVEFLLESNSSHTALNGDVLTIGKDESLDEIILYATLTSYDLRTATIPLTLRFNNNGSPDEVPFETTYSDFKLAVNFIDSFSVDSLLQGNGYIFNNERSFSEILFTKEYMEQNNLLTFEAEVGENPVNIAELPVGMYFAVVNNGDKYHYQNFRVMDEMSLKPSEEIVSKSNSSLIFDGSLGNAIINKAEFDFSFLGTMANSELGITSDDLVIKFSEYFVENPSNKQVVTLSPADYSIEEGILTIPNVSSHFSNTENNDEVRIVEYEISFNNSLSEIWKLPIENQTIVIPHELWFFNELDGKNSVYNDFWQIKFMPKEIVTPSIVEAVNQAEDESTLRSILETRPNELNLDLLVYNSENFITRNRQSNVIRSVFNSKPSDGYETLDSIKSTFEVSVALEKAKLDFSAKVFSDTVLMKSDFEILNNAYNDYVNFHWNADEETNFALSAIHNALDIGEYQAALYEDLQAFFNVDEDSLVTSEVGNAYNIESVYDYLLTWRVY